MTLDAQQLEAVNSQSSFIVVAACAGSGKTTTLIERIIRLVRVVMVDPQKIIVLTFTNAAAHELVVRLKLCGITLGYVGTLHGWCGRLIRRFGRLIGYRSGHIAILPEAERVPFLKQIMLKNGKRMTMGDLLAREHPDAELVWKEYYFELRKNNLVDWEGELRDAAALLKIPGVLEEMKLHTLCVDEYHDSAALDQLIYDRIPAANKFVVGDGDQCVYAFRGAWPEGFVDLCSRKNVHLVKLENNYRSDTAICEAANRLIFNNTVRVPKMIVPVSKMAGSVLALGFEDPFQELAFVANEYRKHGNASMAVLARYNFDVTRAWQFCAAQGLPVQKLTAPMMPADWKLTVLLLSLCVSPDNDIIAEQYLRAINTPAVQGAKALAASLGKKLTDYLNLVLNDVTFATFPQFLAHRGISQESIALVQQRMAVLSNEEPTLADLLGDLYAHDEGQRASKGNDSGIYFGTLHSAKGREWDMVFLTAFEEGIIPTEREKDTDKATRALEEERRLAFVGLTRARHHVYITHSTARAGEWSTSTSQRPSRFIEEMQSWT